MTVVAAAADTQMRVYIVMCPGGRPWDGRSFSTKQFACGAIVAAAGQYWPELEAAGYRIIPATLRW